MAEALLHIEDLTKRFGGVVASDRISLAVAAGELHAIIGPNGAGKTTLIGELTGEVAPDTGRIHFDGRDVPAERARARAFFPYHVAFSRLPRPRQRGACGAGACRPFVPFLARRP